MNRTGILMDVLSRKTRGVRCAAAIVAIAASAATAGNGDRPTSSLADLGTVFEKASRRAAPERGETLNDLDVRVTDLLGDLKGNDKAAAYFLSGEIRFASGRYDEAAQAFKSAAKEAKDSPLAADAAFAYIQSQEAAGHAAQAEREWAQWL